MLRAIRTHFGVGPIRLLCLALILGGMLWAFGAALWTQTLTAPMPGVLVAAVGLVGHGWASWAAGDA